MWITKAIFQEMLVTLGSRKSDNPERKFMWFLTQLSRIRLNIFIDLTIRSNPLQCSQIEMVFFSFYPVILIQVNSRKDHAFIQHNTKQPSMHQVKLVIPDHMLLVTEKKSTNGFFCCFIFSVCRIIKCWITHTDKKRVHVMRMRVPTT